MRFGGREVIVVVVVVVVSGEEVVDVREKGKARVETGGKRQNGAYGSAAMSEIV